MDSTGLEIFKALVNWPFLAFLLILLGALYFRGAIADAIRRGGIKVSMGGNEVTIGQAVEQIDDEIKQSLEDFKSTMEEVRGIRADIDVLKQAVPAATAETFATHSTQATADAGAWPKMKRALESSQYRWRSIERLAIIVGISDERALGILADHDDEVVLGENGAGKRIARMANR